MRKGLTRTPSFPSRLPVLRMIERNQVRVGFIADPDTAQTHPHFHPHPPVIWTTSSLRHRLFNVTEFQIYLSTTNCKIRVRIPSGPPKLVAWWSNGMTCDIRLNVG